MTQQDLKGRILEIQRMSTDDGPGIRTTVFFKGCSLKCRWCHNPESISPHTEIQWIASRCIGCRSCIDICPEKALQPGPEGIRIDRSRCTGCGLCAEECPSTAMEQLGRSWTVGALFAELLKDRAYFEQSGGGVTLSGGEPGLQAPFAEALLKALRSEGIHTALDTCGAYPKAMLEKLLPHAGMVLFDIKEMDASRHRAFTGAENRQVLENVVYIADYIRGHLYPRALWIRTPIIPDTTDRPENIERIGAFIAEQLAGAVTRWELCAFNNLCKDKYKRLGRIWAYDSSELATEAQMRDLAEIAKSSGVDPAIVHISGATRLPVARERGNNAVEKCSE